MTTFPLDLIELERIEPAHAESIRKKEGSSMSDLELLVAETRKNLDVADRIRSFIDETGNRELASTGRTPATALMMAGIIEIQYACLETLFLRVSRSFESHLEE